MLKHTTIIFKTRAAVQFYKDHDPIIDEEYQSWIRSLPGVISLTNTDLSEIKMERIIEFVDDAAYKNWLKLRKTQESWKVRRDYEKKHGIITFSSREEI